MLKSMTGYGAGRYEENCKTFVVEIKSVNHKYNEISVKLPRTMLAFEEPIRKMVSSKISRGKIDTYVNYESTLTDDTAVIFNEVLGDNVFSEFNKIRDRYGISEEVSLTMLSRFPNIIAAGSRRIDEITNSGELWPLLEKAVSSALDNFIQMREKEGENLRVDVLSKINEIESITSKIDERSATVVSEYKDKLNNRIREMLSEAVDEQRLLYEVVIFADKSAIDEELTRLKSHIKQFRSILNESYPVGKKLDFIVQEMIRESNTIGSKSNCLDITNAVIELKTIIEKIREQIQNIE